MGAKAFFAMVCQAGPSGGVSARKTSARIDRRRSFDSNFASLFWVTCSGEQGLEHPAEPNTDWARQSPTFEAITVIHCITSRGSSTTTLPQLRSPQILRRGTDWLWICGCWGTAVLCVGSVILAALEAGRRERAFLAVSLVGVAIALICRMLISQDPCLLRAFGLVDSTEEGIEEEATVEIRGIEQCFEVADGDDSGPYYVLVTRDKEYVLVGGPSLPEIEDAVFPAQSVTLLVRGCRREVIRWNVSGTFIDSSGLFDLRDPTVLDCDVAILRGLNLPGSAVIAE